MSTDFQMNYHHNKDNLHVKMQGIFDGNSAHELLNLFLREYRCGGRVFVDTAGVSEVLPFGSKVLQARLCQTPVPASQLFFKAKTGMGTEDAHVAANTITIINFFPSGAFS